MSFRRLPIRVLLVALVSRGSAGLAKGDRRPPPRLRDTGLYSDWNGKVVDPRNIPYSPQYPLWSDGAAKRRWIRIPARRHIDASDPNAWVFPAGTRLWKEFSFGRAVETRYMERLPSGEWLFASYVWDKDGEARLAPEGGILSTAEIRPGLLHATHIKRGEYLIKTSGCNDCHTPLKMGPTGPEPDWSRLLSGHPADLALPAAPKLPPGPWMATPRPASAITSSSRSIKLGRYRSDSAIACPQVGNATHAMADRRRDVRSDAWSSW
jgi:hypothetical protein